MHISSTRSLLKLGLVALSTCFFSIAILNEAVKQLRITYQEEAIGICRVRDRSVNTPVENNAIEDEEDTNPLLPTNLGLSMTKLKVLDGVLFSIQMVLSYLLMLVVMSYSVWLFFAIVFGQAIGSSIFFHSPQNHLKQSFQAPIHPPCHQSIAPNMSEEEAIETTSNVAVVEVH